MAIAAAGLQVELREVRLQDKPLAMLAASPKGTVPVLVLPDGQVIDESLAVMDWALNLADPEDWLGSNTPADPEDLIATNDGPFKSWLDKYKYADRHPEQSMAWYRTQAEAFLSALEARLQRSRWLAGDSLSLADVALLPFIRQFAGVDEAWFANAPYPALRIWLRNQLQSERFAVVMEKHPPWTPGAVPLRWPRRAPFAATG